MIFKSGMINIAVMIAINHTVLPSINTVGRINLIEANVRQIRTSRKYFNLLIIELFFEDWEFFMISFLLIRAIRAMNQLCCSNCCFQPIVYLYPRLVTSAG